MIGESVFFISAESSTYTNILLEYVGFLFALLHFFRELLFPIISLFYVSYINGIIPVVTSFLDKVVSLLISFIESFILFVIIVFIFWLIVWFLSENRKIEIYPFKVSGGLGNYDARIIPECLVAESRRILKRYQATNQIFEHISRKGKIFSPYNEASSLKISGTKNTTNPGPNSKMAGVLFPEVVLTVINMSLSSESIETEISNVGNFSIAGVSIPLGELILILKQMHKSQNSSQYITGCLQKSDSEICLIALMSGRKQYSWELSDRSIYYGEDKINVLIKNLASRIIYDLSVEQNSDMDVTGLQAKTWEGFKLCTEAVDSFLLYIKTAKLKYLENVRKSCIEGLEIEKEYPLLFQLFFLLELNILTMDIILYRKRYFVDV